MKYTLIFLFYYLYAIFVVASCGYVVFYLNRSGWWFLLALLLVNITPKISSKKEN